jgi:hypothetical protein
MTLGRPRMIKKDDEEKIIRQYQLGLNVNEVLGVMNIKRSTYYDYLKANEGFSEQIDYAKGNITMISKVLIAKDIKAKDSKTSLTSATYMIDKHEGKPMQAHKIEQDTNLSIVVKSYKDIDPVEKG